MFFISLAVRFMIDMLTEMRTDWKAKSNRKKSFSFPTEDTGEYKLIFFYDFFLFTWVKALRSRLLAWVTEYFGSRTVGFMTPKWLPDPTILSSQVHLGDQGYTQNTASGNFL